MAPVRQQLRVAMHRAKANCLSHADRLVVDRLWADCSADRLREKEKKKSCMECSCMKEV